MPPFRLITTKRVCCLLGLAALAARLPAVELNVSAAASLSDVLQEIAVVYESNEGRGNTVRFNFGGSNMLARQIKEGAPADVFFSADEAKMDDLAAAGLVDTDTRRTLLANSLVIVVALDRGAPVETPADLTGSAVRRIALAETQTVPAGIYARGYLQRSGLWERVAAKVVATENVRAALAAVEGGNADAGIVYKTDAMISRRVKVVYEVPIADGPPITYPVAVLKEARHAEAARKFVAHLASPAAAEIFIRHGFVAVGEGLED